MKAKYKIVLFYFLSPFITFSQQWAEIGTKWYYDSMDNGSSPPSSSYFLYESTKDTLINNINCKKIEITLFSRIFGVVERTPEFMYSDSGKIYYYWNNSFQPLYDFSANTGDTFPVFNRMIPDTNPNNITLFMVDSTKLFKDAFSNMSFYGIDSFKVQYIKAISNNGYEVSFGYNILIENIGSIDLMFPTPPSTIPEKDGPLRCFQNDSLWLKAFPLSCDYWVTSIDKTNLNNEVTITPNPFTFQITLTSSGNITSIKIQNLLGEIIYSEKILNPNPDSYRDLILNLDVPNGIYFLTAIINQQTQTFKIVKI